MLWADCCNGNNHHTSANETTASTQLAAHQHTPDLDSASGCHCRSGWRCHGCGGLQLNDAAQQLHSLSSNGCHTLAPDETAGSQGSRPTAHSVECSFARPTQVQVDVTRRQ
jgi:hypothetical protein